MPLPSVAQQATIIPTSSLSALAISYTTMEVPNEKDQKAPAKDRVEIEGKLAPPPATEPPNDGLDHTTQVTCDALCSLMGRGASPGGGCSEQMSAHDSDECPMDSKCKDGRTCPKQLQLPMFLSKTYHMISRSNPDIACWSEAGDNFVIKNVDKFAASVLPLYFKHSNFSSFARQLNFYGFRKLRSEPLLTAELDPQTAGHVRFFHEKFQRDHPELLQHIKRATKTDQQSKDEMETLRMEVSCLRDTLAGTTAEYERRLAELSYDFNRRLSATNAEFDNLAAMVHRALAKHMGGDAPPPPQSAGVPPGNGLRSMSGASSLGQGGQGSDPLHSLSHIASLHQSHGLRPPTSSNFSFPPPSTLKRPTDETTSTTAHTQTAPTATRPRLG